MAADERSELERRLSMEAQAIDPGSRRDLYGVRPAVSLLREAADALAECRRALADQVARCVSCAGAGTIPPPEDVETVEPVHLPCTRCAAARAALAKLEDKS